MKRYVISFAVLGAVAFALRFLNEWAPLLLMFAGVLVAGLGFKYSEIKNSPESVDFGVRLTPYGVLAIAAALALTTLDGNRWLLLFSAAATFFAGICVHDRRASGEPWWPGFLYDFVPVGIVLLGLWRIQFLPDHGLSLLVSGLVGIGLTAFAGCFMAHRPQVPVSS